MIIHLTSFFLVATATTLFFLGGVIAGSDEWKHDLDSANALLSQGKYIDAIALYDTVLRISLPLMILNFQRKIKRIIYHIINEHYHISDYIDTTPLFLI